MEEETKRKTKERKTESERLRRREMGRNSETQLKRKKS